MHVSLAIKRLVVSIWSKHYERKQRERYILKYVSVYLCRGYNFFFYNPSIILNTINIFLKHGNRFYLEDRVPATRIRPEMPQVFHISHSVHKHKHKWPLPPQELTVCGHSECNHTASHYILTVSNVAASATSAVSAVKFGGNVRNGPSSRILTNLA